MKKNILLEIFLKLYQICDSIQKLNVKKYRVYTKIEAIIRIELKSEEIFEKIYNLIFEKLNFSHSNFKYCRF